MDPLGISASIIAVLQLSSQVLGFLVEVKNANEDRARCTIEISNLFAILTTLRSRLEDGTAESEWFSEIQALHAENGPLDQFHQALKTLHKSMTSGGKMQSLMWKFKKAEINSILDTMERLKSTIQLALQTDQFKLSQAIKDDTQFTRKHIPELEYQIGSLNKTQDQERHEELLKWLTPLDFSARLSDYLSRRQEGTCEWFFEAPQYLKWRDEPKNTLFCSGMPGAGKTMIASVTIEHLLRAHSMGNVGVAYAFCNHKTQHEQRTIDLLSAMMKQLAQARPQSAKPVHELRDKLSKKGTKPTLEDISSTLRAVIAGHDTVYIVVDALDEYYDSDRPSFLSRLNDLRSKCDVRIMLTSRPHVHDHFREAFKEANILRLEVRASDEDIKHYVGGQIYRLPRCIQNDIMLQDDVKDAVASAAAGMFLLARLHTDALQDKRTRRNVKLAVSQFSKGSDSLKIAYDEAIARLESQPADDVLLAKKVLSWITFAKRPLTKTEMCWALAVEPGDKRLDTENFPDAEDLMAVCAGLVTIDEETTIIRLVHYTTQEYLESISSSFLPSAELNIARTCITYLTFDNTVDQMDRKRLFDGRAWLDRHALMSYTSEYWGIHTFPYQTELKSLALPFLQNVRARFRHKIAAGIVSSLRKGHGKVVLDFETRGGPPTILHLIARYGLSILLQELWSCDQDQVISSLNTDHHEQYQRAPLFVAAEFGHIPVLDLLIQYGATKITGFDLKAHKEIPWFEKGMNAVSRAIAHGHEHTAKFLLGKGIPIDAYSYDAAYRNRFNSLLKTLLMESANCHERAKRYLLMRTLVEENRSVTIILLQAGVGACWNKNDWIHFFTNPFTGRCGNPYGPYLYDTGSFHWVKELVLCMLDQKYHVDGHLQQDHRFMEAISTCGFDEYEDILAKGMEFLQHRDVLEEVLHKACRRGWEEVVRALLDRMVDIDLRGADLGVALAVTCRASTIGFGPHDKIIRLLVEAGADVNATESAYGAPILEAYQLNPFRDPDHFDQTPYGYLLGRGFNIRYDCLGGTQGSFLNLAAFRGDNTTLHQAYEHNKIPHVFSDELGRTPLHLAALGGYLETFKYLLGRRLDIEAKDVSEGTVLNYACMGGHAMIIDMILQCCKTSLENENSWSSLHWACRHGDWKIVERLIEFGVRSRSVSAATRVNQWSQDLNATRIAQWSPYSIAIFFQQNDMLDKLSRACLAALHTDGENIETSLFRYERCCICSKSIFGPIYGCDDCLKHRKWYSSEGQGWYCFMCRPLFDRYHVKSSCTRTVWPESVWPELWVKPS